MAYNQRVRYSQDAAALSSLAATSLSVPLVVLQTNPAASACFGALNGRGKAGNSPHATNALPRSSSTHYHCQELSDNVIAGWGRGQGRVGSADPPPSWEAYHPSSDDISVDVGDLPLQSPPPPPPMMASTSISSSSSSTYTDTNTSLDSFPSPSPSLSSSPSPLLSVPLAASTTVSITAAYQPPQAFAASIGNSTSGWLALHIPEGTGRDKGVSAPFLFSSLPPSFLPLLYFPTSSQSLSLLPS